MTQRNRGRYTTSPLRFSVLPALTGLLLACGGGDDEPRVADRTEPGEHRGHPTAPLQGWGPADPDQLAAGRLDTTWRGPASADLMERTRRRAGSRADTARGTAGAGDTTRSGAAARDTATTEAWDNITPERVNATPDLPLTSTDGGPTTLRVQVLLDRARFSPGVIDGRWGKNTEKAVYWLQHEEGLEPTGTVDRETYDRLLGRVGEMPPLARRRLTEEDVSGPFVDIPDDVYEQAELDCLCYRSAREKVAERYHLTPELLAKLNPDSDLGALRAGLELWLPNVRVAQPDTGTAAEGEGGAGGRIARIVISKDGFYTHALDEQERIVMHFPSTLGAGYDPSPTGDYRITAIAWNPDFHYQPELFHEVPDEEPEAMLPPGPNSPVGVVWMALSKPHYGIHGTAEPSTIGYTSSHGCIRLTNWDAVTLGSAIRAGVPVTFR